MNPPGDPATSSAVLKYFGTRPTPMSFDEWLASIDTAISSGSRHRLSGHHNLHSLYLNHIESAIRDFYQRCDECYIDGMPVRLILAGAGIPISATPRFSLMDTFPKLLEQARQRGWTVFYLGSSAEVQERARYCLNENFPGLDIHVRHGYFEEDQPMVDLINEIRPDLLLVGMGMPRQESWLLEHIDNLDVAVATQAGATLDYFTGAQARPPLWLSNLGLAWLYRMLRNPFRLSRRYLLEPWGLVLPTLKLWLGR